MGVDDQQLQAIWDKAQESTERRKFARRQPPLVRLWSASADEWIHRGAVVGDLGASFEWKLNDTGAGHITLPWDHHLGQWAMRWWERDKKNVMVTVDKDGARWSGLLDEIVTRMDEDGVRTIELSFLHDYEQLKHLPVWSNPFTPAGLQVPKTFMLMGPAAYILKVSLFVNLWRQNGSFWQLPDDPLDPKTWIQGLSYKRWPFLVQPGTILKDSTPLRYIHSRFKTWHDMAAPILEDCRLMVTCRRWLEGDPQPWPGAGLTRNGQLIFDVVDKSGWWEQTSTGGTIIHGLVRTGLEVADNLVDEVRNVLEAPADADEYAVSGFLGVAPKQPWIVYSTNGETRNVRSSEYSYKPPTVGQVTVGGKSMPGVNELMSASTKLIFNILGSFILQPGLGAVIDTALNPLYSDTIGAFMSLKSPLRTRQLGWGHYMENFHSADSAYTLSSLMVLRQGFRDTDEKVSHTLDVGDGAPYLIGENGEGHYFLGDRIGAEIPGARDGRVDVAPVVGLTLGWTIEQPHEWAVTIGNWPDRDPVEWAIQGIKELSAGLQEVGLL